MRKMTVLILFVFGLHDVSWGQAKSARPAVAYSYRGTLRIVSQAGKVLKTFRPQPSIGTFDISPDAEKVVFAPPGPEGHGGPLFLLTLATGKIERLTSGHVYDAREVYSNPDFSPDGASVVFAVHSQPHGDAVMASGPFAVLDMSTKKVRALPSTINVQGYGAAYGDSPRWSPDGRRISLNLESDFALTDPSGEHLQDTSGWTSGDGVTFAVDWLGNGCVVYVGGKDWKASEEQPAKVLHLITHQTEPLDKLLAIAPEQVTNLIAFSPTIRVRKAEGKLVVRTDAGSWSLYDTDQHPNVRILSNAKGAQVPETCR